MFPQLLRADVVRIGMFGCHLRPRVPCDSLDSASLQATRDSCLAKCHKVGETLLEAISLKHAVWVNPRKVSSLAMEGADARTKEEPRQNAKEVAPGKLRGTY